jgi:hypothetical protein
MKKQIFYLTFIILLFSLLHLPMCKAAGYWGNNSNVNVEHQKMLSTIEYTGEGQFKHHVETQLKIEKETLSDERVRYSISSSDFGFSGSGGQETSAAKDITFIVDKNTGRISNSSSNITMLEKVNNNCLNSLQQVTKENIGKTWKQSFDLSSFDYSLPKNLTFTMSAINVNTGIYGRMIAVRALSEPFTISILNSEGKVEKVQARVRSAYLFDVEIENVFLSMSVFDAAADINSKNEKLRYELATYKTDADGKSVDLKGLGIDFENFIRKVGLSSQDLKVEKETSLPGWAQSEGLRAVQISNICAAAACEGALNPVTTITMPAARTIALQSTNGIISASQISTISATLAQNVSALGGMKIAIAPAWAGYGLMTGSHVTAIAGATAGGVAIAEYNDDDTKSRSPVVP